MFGNYKLIFYISSMALMIRRGGCTCIRCRMIGYKMFSALPLQGLIMLYCKKKNQISHPLWEAPNFAFLAQFGACKGLLVAR